MKNKLDKYIYGINNLLPIHIYDPRDKKRVIRDHIDYMLSRTQSMFRYDGLPDTIPARMLELYLQVNGNVAIVKVNDELYAMWGSRGGEPDAYYMPTKYIVANPALNYSTELTIDKDCIVIPNDPMYKGLMPLFSRYATALCENEVSLFIADVNSRIQNLISASDDKSKTSAELFIKRIFDGELSVIGENAFLEGVKSSPYGTTGTHTITDLIEYEQYLRAGWFNELGLNSNYNMKRESINSNESQLNDDMLHPLIDEMLKCRREALEKVNSMFGTSISVSLDSAWEDNERELNAELENVENDEEPNEGGEGENNEPNESE